MAAERLPLSTVLPRAWIGFCGGPWPCVGLTALALASAASDTPLPKNLVAIGEVGLAGEVRRVTGVQRRLAEAARLGFTHALVPADPGKVPPGMKVTEVADMGDALRVLPRRASREASQSGRPT